MSKRNELLLDDGQLIVVQTSLAILVGDRQAMALQQIHYWAGINQKADKTQHFIDGQWWVYNTWREWRERNFPFWTLSTVRRVFTSLEADALIVTRPHDNRNKGLWVTINYGQLELLLASNAEGPRVKRLQERAKRRGSAQNEQGGLLKMNRPSAQNEQTLGNTENTETTAENKNIDDANAPSPSPAPQPDTPPAASRPANPWYDAIKATWGFTGSRNGGMEKMLRGTATSKQHKHYNLETPLTDPAQLADWKRWYLNVKQRGKGDAILVSAADKVQSSIGEWQDAMALRLERQPATAPAFVPSVPTFSADELKAAREARAAEMNRLHLVRRTAVGS